MNRSSGELTFTVLNYAFFVAFSLSILFPFVNLLAVSLTQAESLNISKVKLIPDPFSAESYRMILTDRRLYYSYYSTIFRTVVGTGLAIFIMFCAAYPLSKKALPHRTFYTSIFVFTMFFGGGLIPTYLLIKSLGLLDNRLVLVIPGAVSAFNLLVIRNFLMSLPQELEESAFIDGANDIQILFRIVMPLSKPVLATVSLWVAVSYWNEWFQSMIYINDPNKQVVQVWLRRLVIESSDEYMQKVVGAMEREMGYPIAPETVKAAAIFVTIVPILMVYPFIQRYFVKGVMIGSLKG